jgi:hypothetical protein
VEAVRRNVVPLDAGRQSAAFRQGPGSLVLTETGDGACVFFEPAAGRLCAIHRAVGPGLLPVACRNFPRVALRDARGLFVTLSHYCPTAARLLLSATPLSIVPAPASLSLDGEADGLDATEVLPPLLRPGMLLTLEGYTAWERHAVTVFGDDERDLDARDALDIVSRATAAICEWRPGTRSLVTAIDDGFAVAGANIERAPRSGSRAVQRAARRFLAAHAFASWAAYQDGGLLGIVRSLETALALLTRELAAARTRMNGVEESLVAAVRATDFQLRHTRDHVSP